MIINNEKQLTTLLKLITNEAVKHSRVLKERPDISGYLSQIKKDESIYGKLREEEDVEPEEEEFPEEPRATKEKEPAEETEPDKEKPEVRASFDSVVKAVNNLRSGKSLRDTEIQKQAQDYYDKLTEDERTTLLIFLKSLSDIITGQISGSEAADPSDPPSLIKIFSGEEEDQEPQQKQDTRDEEEEPEEELEDTSPPIRVNESQDFHHIRRKIKRLMKRG